MSSAAPHPPAPAAAKSPAGMGWLLPVALVAAWWVHDLSYQWSSLVDYKFGWMVVLLAAYLVWERWPSRPRDDQPGGFGISLLLALVGFPAVLLAEFYRLGLTRTATSSMTLSMGSALFIAAFIRLIWGPKTLRHFLFPMLFFFLAVPIPKFFWDPVVLGLQSFVATLNVEALNLIGIPAEQQGHVIRLPNAVVGVDEACSGVRSLQSSIMAALFIGDLILRRASLKVFFGIAGVVLAVIGNFGRSFYLSLTAHQKGTQALEAVHDPAGWTVLAFTAGGIALLAWLVTKLEKRLATRLAAAGA